MTKVRGPKGTAAGKDQRGGVLGAWSNPAGGVTVEYQDGNLEVWLPWNNELLEKLRNVKTLRAQVETLKRANPSVRPYCVRVGLDHGAAIGERIYFGPGQDILEALTRSAGS